MPTIKEITVQAGTVFNHPHENYSNLRPSVTLRAVVEAGEDPIEAAKALQAQAEDLLADQKTAILARLHREEAVRTARYEIGDCERRIRAGYEPEKRRETLDAIAAEFPELAGEAEAAKKAEPQGERAIQRAAEGGLDDDRHY